MKERIDKRTDNLSTTVFSRAMPLKKKAHKYTCSKVLNQAPQNTKMVIMAYVSFTARAIEHWKSF